jgi:uncharacterized protein
MSEISFLDNASQGENSIWRYIFTIILTWGAPIVIEIIILISAMIYLLTQGINMGNYLELLVKDPMITLATVGITAVFSVIFLYFGVRYIHKRKFISLVNTDSRFSIRRLLKGWGIWFGLLTIGTVISLLIDPSGFKITFNPSTFSFLLILSFLVFPIQASFEELFFRGYLMQGIGLLSKKPVVPLIITSAIFSLAHYFNGGTTLMSVDIILQTLIVGLTLGIITLGENRLETAMGVHIANNMFVCLIVNNPDSLTQNLPSLFTNTAIPDPLIDSVGIGIYALVLLVVVFWGKKENLYGIFRMKKSLPE